MKLADLLHIMSKFSFNTQCDPYLTVVVRPLVKVKRQLAVGTSERVEVSGPVEDS